MQFCPTHAKVSCPRGRELLFSYFNLCAEEYFFHKAGYVDQDVWKSWYRGMSVFFEFLEFANFGIVTARSILIMDFTLIDQPLLPTQTLAS